MSQNSTAVKLPADVQSALDGTLATLTRKFGSVDLLAVWRNDPLLDNDHPNRYYRARIAINGVPTRWWWAVRRSRWMRSS